MFISMTVILLLFMCLGYVVVNKNKRMIRMIRRIRKVCFCFLLLKIISYVNHYHVNGISYDYEHDRDIASF
jgi:membrane-anchored protein YejM (alkaline phosphatase superfamily)